MPGVPGPIQRQDLDKVAKTYGKTIHFWQIDGHLQYNLAKGTFLCDEFFLQMIWFLVTLDSFKRFNVSFDAERENRDYMKGPEHGIHHLANGGRKKIKTVLRETDCKPVESVPRVSV
ncbi:hypothetical protein MKX01_033583 [Papaver californicum]|nr:hypothetical protein MKX01_033583 [Papaver californicum]